MVKYYIDSYKNAYAVIRNGITKSANLYNKNEIIKAFEEQAENRVLAVFEINESEAVSLVDPYDIGIFNKLSHYMYLIHDSHNNYIAEKIDKVAAELSKKGHADLSNFLNLATNIALNKSRSNMDVDSFVEKMGSEDSAKGKLFKKIYNEMYSEAKAQGLDNPQKLATMSALKIIGANGRRR